MDNYYFNRKEQWWMHAKTDRGISLCTSTGIRNPGRIAEYRGLHGNRKEPSWNPEMLQHDCCSSKVSWRHKNQCPARSFRAV